MAKVIKTVTLAPGEDKPAEFQFRPMEARVYQVSVDGLSGSFSVIEAPPPPALELVEAYFDDAQPMTKKPGDTFTVTIKLRNNLERDTWNPTIYIGFGHAPFGPLTYPPVTKVAGFDRLVWGWSWLTGELYPEYCWHVGIGNFAMATPTAIEPMTTKQFRFTYGLCPDAAEGLYDGYIGIGDSNAIIFPNILAIGRIIPKLTLLAARLYDARWGPRRLGGYAIFGKVDVTITNNEGRTLTGQSPDYVDLQVTILRASDRGQCGFVKFSRDIPPGTNTITLDRTDKGWGVSEVTLSPGTFNYILKIKVVLLGWPGNPYVEAEFPGTTVLG